MTSLLLLAGRKVDNVVHMRAMVKYISKVIFYPKQSELHGVVTPVPNVIFEVNFQET